jgi:thiol-disulfide isomerase/thioredoxin
MPPKFKGQKQNESTIKYVLIAALIILLSFAFVYIYNIQKSSRVERFNIIEEEEEEGGTESGQGKSGQGNSGQGKSMRVIYMYSNGCPYCKTFAPVFDEYSRTSQLQNVVFETIEKNNPKSAMFMDQISGFPTVIIVDRNDTIIGSQVGSTTLMELTQFVESTTQTNL